jgi:FAD:protein FMN transferase
MERRDFIEPANLAHSAGEIWGALQELSEPHSHAPAPSNSYLRLQHRAMATDWELIFPFGAPEAMHLADRTFARIDELEDQLSVYREHSEISKLNRSAFEKPVKVESSLFGLLEHAARLNAETEGAFDIAAGALIRAWGFFRGPRRVPDQRELAGVLANVGMKHVQLNPDASTVRFLRSSIEINLGAIGKGYAIDRAVQLLRREGNAIPALLHGGHSSVYAIGSEPGTERGWLVEIGHPLYAGSSLGTLRLRDQAMGTSAATFQYFEHHGRKLGHILDPRIGWPARGVESATVIAPTAAQADALATAFFILGPRKAEEYCRTHDQIGAILLLESCRHPEVFGANARTFRPACPS